MDLIKLELTPRELVHVRVAMLHRLSLLQQGPQTDHTTRSYAECLALMETGGKLHIAMLASHRIIIGPV